MKSGILCVKGYSIGLAAKLRDFCFRRLETSAPIRLAIQEPHISFKRKLFLFCAHFFVILQEDKIYTNFITSLKNLLTYRFIQLVGLYGCIKSYKTYHGVSLRFSRFFLSQLDDLQVLDLRAVNREAHERADFVKS